MRKYQLETYPQTERFLAVSPIDQTTVSAALDAAGVHYKVLPNSSSMMANCVLFDFEEDCNHEAIQKALDSVVRTQIEVKPLRPMSFRS